MHLKGAWNKWGDGNENHPASSSSSGQKAPAAKPKGKFPERVKWDLTADLKTGDAKIDKKLGKQLRQFEEIACEREKAWYLSKDTKYSETDLQDRLKVAMKKIFAMVDEAEEKYKKLQGQHIRAVKVPSHFRSKLPKP